MRSFHSRRAGSGTVALQCEPYQTLVVPSAPRQGCKDPREVPSQRLYRKDAPRLCKDSQRCRRIRA